MYEYVYWMCTFCTYSVKKRTYNIIQNMVVLSLSLAEYKLVPVTIFVCLESRTKDFIFFRKRWNNFFLDKLGTTITCILPLFTLFLYERYRFIDFVNNLFLFYSMMKCDLQYILSCRLCKYLQRCSYVRNSSTYWNMKSSFTRRYTTWYRDHRFLLWALCFVKWDRGI